MRVILTYAVVIITMLVAGLYFIVPKVDPSYGVVYLAAKPSENSPLGGAGSGFIVGENFLVTNSHVINYSGPKNLDGSEYRVYAHNDRTPYEIKVIFNDPVLDLAFFQIKDWDEFKEKERFKILKIEDNPVHQGDEIAAYGSPYGDRGIRTEGTFSAINRMERRQDGGFSFGHYVTTVINPGNSGGPIVNTNGNVVGVSEIKGNDVYFAISGDLLDLAIRNFKTKGKMDLPVSKSMFEVRDEDGEFVITSVGDDQYKKAGLEVGDTIQAVHSKFTEKYGTPDIWDPEQIVVYTKMMVEPNETIILEVERNGITLPLTVKFE